MESNSRNFGYQTNQQTGQGRTSRLCPTCSLTVSDDMSICPNDGTALSGATVPQLVNNLAGQYEFLSKIGEGGMGVIYKARHLALNNLVAIKMMNVNRLDHAKVLRFQQEAKAVSSLDHPAIVRVRDFGISEAGQPHMVLDFIDGITLEQMIKTHGPVSLTEARDIFMQICDGVAHAHQRNVLHRDLKPSNIMLVQRENEPPAVKIVDFGIAKIVDGGEQGMNLTQTGEVMGSPFYMSPEQTNGKEMDKRSDVYSVGCVLFEALTGAPPFVGKNSIETLIKHTSEAPPTLKEGSLGKTFPDELQAVVNKALAKDPNERFQNMTQLKIALMNAIDEGTKPQANKESTQGSGKAFSLNKALIAAIVGTLCVLVAAGMAMYKTQPKQVAANVPATSLADDRTINPQVDVKSAGESGSEQAATHTSTSGAAPSSPSLAAVRSDPLFGDSNKFGIMHDVMDPDIMLRNYLLGHKNAEVIEFESLCTDKGLDFFEQMKNVKIVSLEQSNIVGEGMLHLTHLPLESLNMSGSNLFGDEGMEHVLAMKGLESLKLDGTAISDSSLDSVMVLKKLKTLSLCNTKITGVGLQSLERCRNLKSLSISGCQRLQDVDLKKLSRLKNLEDLKVANTELSDAVLRTVVGEQTSPRLKVLDISGTQITDKGIKELKRLPALEELHLAKTKITGASLQWLLANAPSLKILDIAECEYLRPQDFKILQGFKALNTLNLHKSRITDEGVKFVANIGSLHELNLEDTNITDASLNSLLAAKGLKLLNVIGSKGVTQGGVANFLTAAPNCVIPDENSAGGWHGHHQGGGGFHRHGHGGFGERARWGRGAYQWGENGG